MPKKKASRLPRETPEQKARFGRVREHETSLLEEFFETRARLGRKRYVELDAALGRTSGYLNDVGKGRAVLELDRFLCALDFLGDSPPEFFERLYPRDPIPKAPIGLLLRYREPGPARSRVPCTKELLAWGRELRLDEKGPVFRPDPEELLKLVRRDFDAAERLAIAGIESFLKLSDGTIARCSAVPIIKWLAILASVVRVRGDRNTAAEIFDLAFRIESQIEDLACRAFVLRNAAYLLGDWGYLSEAKSFALKSIDLATVVGDLPGIGISQYMVGAIAFQCGCLDEAQQRLEGSVHFLGEDQTETIACARHAIALIQMERGQRDLASETLAQISEAREQWSRPDMGRFLNARGELASLKGSVEEADSYFEQAASIFSEIGILGDLVLTYLHEARHHIRYGRLGKARDRAQALLSIASSIRGCAKGQAALLEIIRLYLRGETTIELAGQAIGEWRRWMPQASFDPKRISQSVPS